MKSRKRTLERVWKAAPLPPAFHRSLESGDWLHALRIYQRHPYYSPPVDTFDLLKCVMHATGVRVDDVKSRFSEKIRLSAMLQRQAPEEVEWGVFWTALNRGDGKTISSALMGAHVSSAYHQIAVAEACAVLLKASGENWEEKIIESVPFATVTRSNLIHVALSQARWDVATEILRFVRLNRSDVMALWPLISQFQWQNVLTLISACPKNSVPYEVALRYVLDNGCSLQLLSEHLEHARVLGDVDVVSPLLNYAIEKKDFDFVMRGIEHLVDIGQVTEAAKRTLMDMSRLHGMEKVLAKLKEHNIPLVKITIENLESLKL